MTPLARSRTRIADVLISTMARALVERGTDLGDEVACILALMEARFLSREIDAHLCTAVDEARAIVAEYRSVS